MNVRMWALVILLAAGPAGARAESPAAENGGSGATTGKKSGAKPGAARKDAAADPAQGSTKATPKTKRSKSYEPEKPRIPPNVRALAKRTRSVFRFSVETCGNPQSHCDASERDDAERRYMDACGACTAFDRCDADRKAIKDGTAKALFDPCGP